MEVPVELMMEIMYVLDDYATDIEEGFIGSSDVARANVLHRKLSDMLCEHKIQKITGVVQGVLHG